MINILRKINFSNSIQTNKNQANNDCYAITFNHKYLSYVANNNTIGLVDYTSENKPVYLSGHYKQIKHLKFSNNNRNLLLCSCSIDYVICWDVMKVLETGETKGYVVAKALEYEPIHCCFHPTDEFLMVCNGNLMTFLDVKSGSNLGTIKCNDFIQNAEFCFFNPDLIIMSSQNAKLNVYNFSTNRLVHSIKTEMNVPYLNICTLYERPIVLTSASNGYLHVYQVSNDNQLKLFKSVSLEKLYFSYLMKKVNEQVDMDVSMLCIGLKLFTISNDDKQFKNQNIMLTDAPINKQFIAACATPICIFFIDIDAIQIVSYIEFKQINSNIMPKSIEFCQIDNNNINLAANSLFESTIDVWRHKIGKKTNKVEKSDNAINNEIQYLSVLTQDMLLDDSPLKEDIPSEVANTKKPIPSVYEYMKTNKYLSKDKEKTLTDKPLTFNSKIKSSGYNSIATKQKPFQPKINKSKSNSSLSKLSKLSGEWSRKPQEIVDDGQNQFEFELPDKLCKKLELTETSKPIFMIKFSDNGKYLATAQADNISQCLLTENLDKNPLVFRGHKDFINNIDISHDCQYLLTCANDKLCKLWCIKKPSSAQLELPQHIIQNDSKNPNSVPITILKEQKTYKKDVLACNFFYMDKFILVAHDNRFYLNQYFIDNDKSDIQSYISNSMVKCVKAMEMSFAQSITCMSAINSFYSYLVFCGGSDRSLEVFDLNKCESSLMISDVHSRPFHQINQNSSEYNQHSYDLFYTNAICDGIKLWDLRTARCVQRYENHISRSLATKFGISPCSNYIFSGSEDRSVYVYDIRMNGLVQKIGGFSDTVMSVQCHPKKSELLCATLDGKLYLYKKV